jgi:hypothetical protein
MSTRDFFWGKGGRCVRLTTYHPRSAELHENPGPYPTRYPLGHLDLLRDDLYLYLLQRNKSTFINPSTFVGSFISLNISCYFHISKAAVTISLLEKVFGLVFVGIRYLTEVSDVPLPHCLQVYQRLPISSSPLQMLKGYPLP